MTTDEIQLDKAYDPKNVEPKWYSVWEKAGYLQPGEKGDPYTIVIPPPNVTGSLHMGHALNSTLQDILIRYKKMTGLAALWVPGTDHGGIATQIVVEKLLKKDGKSRYDLGRDKFLETMWTWRKETGDTILSQLRTLGATLDWTRTRFTMDEVCSKAVRHAFVELYNKKLLYRGKRLVNWCPRCQTALSDIEVEHKDMPGKLWHIRYPFADSADGFIVVATTRPETLLGDTAVAVHPDDERYEKLVGKKIKLPLTNREIPLISDKEIDAKFGSGAVKVTPSHDQTDFEIGERHKLPHIAVIGFDAKMTLEAGSAYAGLDRFQARKQVVEDLEAQGLLEKTEDHRLALSVCYRCESVIEPLESEQWFLSMREMADRAIEANKKGEMRIVPSSWEGPYRLWLENIRDWCVSRQIWWGHRIPVWNCEKGCAPVVAETDPTSCPTCGGKNLVQDPDVLDTWFSSALWPFSVFHWPEKTADLKRFFPTSTLVTGHEILYLWVARMAMFALQFENKIPFKTVLIHGIVRDKQGRKMSKSLGNVVDPLDLIKDYGADAVRFSLAQSAIPGRDMHISPENFVATRNFSNKIWNATRFALMNLEGLDHIEPIDKDKLELADRWVLNRYNEIVKSTTLHVDNLDFSAASRGLYDFFWSDLCDWYVEMVKPRLQSQDKKTVQVVLATVLEGTLRLLHPFIPFITEELWQKLPKKNSESAKHLMAASWPRPDVSFQDFQAEKQISLLQEIVSKLRTIRSEMGILPGKTIETFVESKDAALTALLISQEIVLRSLNTKVDKLTVSADIKRPQGSAAAIVPGANIYVPLEGLIDFSKEKVRLEKELLNVQQDVERTNKKLENPDFVSRAPEEEVSKAKARLIESQERISRLKDNINALQNKS